MSYVPPKDKGTEGKDDASNTLPNVLGRTASIDQENSSGLKKIETANSTRPKKKWSELDLQDKLIVLLTAGIFLITGLTAYIFLQQANVMQGQLEEMRRSGGQTERLIILNQGQLAQTGKQVERLGEQVAQLKRSADEAQNFVAFSEGNAFRDRRPYISLSILDNPVYVEGKKAFWNFHFMNYGRSPAIRLLAKEQIVFGLNNVSKIQKDLFEKIHNSSNKTTGSIVAPNDNNSFSTAQSVEIVTASDIAFINGNDGGIALLIHFEYFDMSGNEYSTEVCKFRLKTGAIANCDVHNVIK